MIYLVFYREWGSQIAKHFPGVSQISSKSDWDSHVYSHSNTYIFIGWSWFIPVEYIKNFNCYCIHPSDLPMYRGGSPIQNQIIDGLEHSAVTLFRMDEGMDSGPIFGKVKISLKGTLTEVFSEIIRGSIELLSSFMLVNESNEISLSNQELKNGSICKRRTPEDSLLYIEELNKYSALQLYNMVRCLQEPYPKLKLIFRDGSCLTLNDVSYEK